MAKQTDDRLVHLYDTLRHRIVCGSTAAEDHSTKHARGVTCHACIALLRESASEGAASGAASASSSAGV
ncbi:MAG TPA: hypothetical protein VIW03_02970 [Anaeromyxobacter sp.]